MVLNTQNMGKVRNGLIAGAAAAGLTLVGASYASSEKSPDTNDRVERVVEPTPDQVSVTPAAYAPVVKLTRDSCVALATKAEKIACMKELKAQRRAEIAALDTGLAQDAETIADNNQANGERLTRNDLLIKQIADKATGKPTQ